eukprot:Tamp_01654.p1 GENE.Tamp_01654~~Tamp_01654.p1  ORF type:complete len:1495 (+),score=224.20 Tamp_01654:241-4485(+)
MHGASCSSPEASVSPMPSEDDSAEGRQDGSTEGSGEDSQSGEDSGQMSAAMNLKEYEARFVHRRRERPKHGSVDSSFQSSGPQDRSASTEESIDFGDGESYGATQEEHSHAAAARVASGDDATLLDPNTGRSMTEAEAIAKIRAEIAAAQAQAQAASEIASAQALARATAAETYSELGSQYADDSGDDGGMTTSSMIMEVADVPNVGPPHRDAEREQTEAQKSTGSSYEDIGKDKSATKDKTQSAGLSRGSAGDEEIDRGLQALVDDGAELMNALPEPNYHQISADLLKSSSPVAVAVRRHQYQLQQGLSATSADFQVKLQAELASAGAIVLPKTTLVAHGDAAQFAGETEKQRDRRLMMERLQKRGRPSVEDLAEGALGGTVKALNLGQPNPDQHSGREPSNPLAAMRAERRASYSEQDDMFPTFTRSRSSGTNSSATFRRVHSTPMSGTAQAGMGISRAPSDVGEMRQFRSLQTRQHISDIHKRIRDMQQHMKDALLDDSMSIATHIRVFQKFDVVAEILHTLGRQMSANKNLPLVLRDKHDESMRLASIECLSIVKESGVEAYTILKQLHDSLVEAQSWLNNIEDEVVRIAEGTVILATSDASELQPVFEQLYIRWQVENSAAGRAFRAWFIIKTDRKAQRDRLVIENVVRRLQQARVVCIRGLFSAWAGARTHRKKTEKIKKTSKFHLLLSAKVWAVNSWKITTVHHKASRRLARKLLRKLQTRSFCSWARLAVEVQEAEVRRQKAEKLAFKKLGRQALYAWFHTILRRNKLKSKLRAAEDVNKVMMCTRAFNAWNALQRRNKYHRQEVSRRLKDRLERDFKEWRLIARILKTQRKRALFLSIRLTNGLKDRTFQLWCESIEDEIIKKMRVDKFISQNRIFWLSSSFRKWAWCAHLTERGVGHFKVRRLFKSLKRYIKLLKEQRRIFDKWSDTNDEIRLHQRFAGWQDYITKLRLGMAKLRAICEEQGGLDEQMCFDRWRAKESKCRLWRYQRRHLQKRQNTNLRIKFWKLWLLNALGKEDLDKAARHAIRMGHTRLRHHTICTAFRVLSSYLTYMLAKKRKILQVAVCNQRRKMQLAWSVWVRLLVASRAFAALQARHIVRFKRRHLKLFSKNVKHRVSRMLFGAWCGECKRPFDRKELQDYTQNPDEVEIRLNENERGIVAAKRQRHHIHHLLQRAKESWSDCSEDEKISTRNHEQMEQAGLLAQYLREIDEAKVMMGQKSDLQDQSQDSRRSDERVKIGTRPLQRRRASREREQMHSAWSKLRNELLSTQRDLQTEGETRERAERSADSNVNFSKELESAAGQRQRWINQKDDNEHGWDQENMAPYNPRELRHRVLEALELAKCELATPLYEGARFDRGELPLLNVPSTHGFEHEVVADKKTAATSTYQLWNEHHLPHAQFVQVSAL